MLQSHTLFVSRLYNKIGGSGLSQNFVILYLLTNKSNAFPPPLLLLAFKLPITGNAECVMLGIYIDLASTLSMYMSWFGHILILTLEHGRRHSHTLFVSR